jgi:hypothetical protein
MSFFSVVERGGAPGQPNLSPFARRFTLPLESVTDDQRYGPFFRKWYGGQNAEGIDQAVYPNVSDAERQVRPGESWRRIDHDWLYSAEQLALALNRGVNNTSLVLAFELSKSKKVLLFVADAQRGNWISWTAGEWVDGDKKITARDLLSRTVLYKVGHHGSHNATLNGTTDDPYPNLSWMGHGKYGNEFSAMITAVSDWAHNKQRPPWNHPLESIKSALDKKSAKRVFQTDTAIDPSEPHWKTCKNVKGTALYFEYEIPDEPL